MLFLEINNIRELDDNIESRLTYCYNTNKIENFSIEILVEK